MRSALRVVAGRGVRRPPGPALAAAVTGLVALSAACGSGTGSGSPSATTVVTADTSPATSTTAPVVRERPADVVDVADVVPGVALDIRYFGEHNFTGRPVPGYEAPRCLLTRRAAEALAGVQADLAPLGLGLKIYDCYRPQQAVDSFVAWAEDVDDQAMKAEFYPGVDKANLFRDGYIAARSGHSRASTVDLTIVPLPVPPEPAFDAAAPLVSCEAPAGTRFPDNSIDMGTGFDCFSTRSHPSELAVGEPAVANRRLLAEAMAAHGFRGYEQEWWHFTLADEPYPDTFFDFPVR